MRGLQPVSPSPVPARRSAAVAIRPERGARTRKVLRLWLPLTPLFLLLSPFALVAAPLLALTPAARRGRPLKLAWVVGAALLSLSGTEVEVESPAARIHIRIV